MIAIDIIGVLLIACALAYTVVQDRKRRRKAGK